MAVNKELLKILACPKCKGDIRERGKFLVCKKCKLAYPVLDGTVPNMLINEAWSLSKAQKAKFEHDLKL